MKKQIVFSVISVLLAMLVLGGRAGITYATVLSSESREPAKGLATATPLAAPGTAAYETADPEHCITGPGKPLECFKTEAEALYAASGGRLNLGSEQRSRDLSDLVLFGLSATVQAILYEHENYGGATLTLYSDGCYGWNNMPGGWNDVVTSARTSSCGITLYEHYNLTGLSLRINSPCTPNVGSGMNDKASSWSLP